MIQVESVSQPVAKLAITTGHAMETLNRFTYSDL